MLAIKSFRDINSHNIYWKAEIQLHTILFSFVLHSGNGLQDLLSEISAASCGITYIRDSMRKKEKSTNFMKFQNQTSENNVRCCLKYSDKET